MTLSPTKYGYRLKNSAKAISITTFILTLVLTVMAIADLPSAYADSQVTLDAVPRYWYKTKVPLSGTVTPGASVSFRVDDSPAAAAAVEGNRWSGTAPLRDGANHITVTAVDAEGKRSEVVATTTLRHAALIAHKGASHDAPEDTIAAFKLAWKQGADIVELDVHESKDHRLMVLHDDTTGATAGTNLVVKDTPSALLRSLDVGSRKGTKYAGERIPFLEEALAELPAGKRLLVEIKSGPEIVSVLQRVIDRSGKERQLIVYATDPAELPVLARVREQMPELTMFYSVSSVPDEGKLVQTALDLGLAGVSVNYKHLTPSLIAALKRAGLQVFAWTVDDWMVVKTLLAEGIDGYLTNWPEIMLFNLRKIKVID